MSRWEQQFHRKPRPSGICDISTCRTWI